MNKINTINPHPEKLSFITNENDERGAGGRMKCSVCKSMQGVYIYKMHRGEQNNWYVKLTCIECKSFEKKKIYSGEVIEQKLKTII